MLKIKEQTDEALMLRAQRGDTDAFAQLYDRHADRAFWVARAICGDRGGAEDALQEGFLAIWRHRTNYSPELGSFKAWAMRIVKNSAIDSYRRAASRPPPQASERNGDQAPADPTDSTPEAEAIAHGEREALLASLRQLPDAQAEVIVLAFYGGLSHSEIAAQLDLPAGTVKGRMRLGLEKIRQGMDVLS